MISLASQRCGGMAPMTGMLEWKYAGSGKADKEQVSPSMSMTSWRAWSSTWGWRRSRLRAYESRLKAGQGQVTL